MHSNNPETRKTLLARVRDVTDHAAWQEFVQDYGPLILGWCRRRGLQDADCSEVVQDVLLRLVVAMRDFEYNAGRGKFRGWLRTVTQHAVADFARHHSRPGAGSGDSAVGRLLCSIEDHATIDDLADVLQKQAEIEVLREAEARVKLKCKPTHWEVWRFSVREDMQAAEVAEQLGVTVSEVYVQRSRINKLVREEFLRMDRFTIDPPCT